MRAEPAGAGPEHAQQVLAAPMAPVRVSGPAPAASVLLTSGLSGVTTRASPRPTEKSRSRAGEGQAPPPCLGSMFSPSSTPTPCSRMHWAHVTGTHGGVNVEKRLHLSRAVGRVSGRPPGEPRESDAGPVCGVLPPVT